MRVSGVRARHTFDSSATQLWNTSTVAYESPVLLNWANYAVTMTEGVIPSKYSVNTPTGFSDPGPYTLSIYLQSGASPSPNDLLIDSKPGGSVSAIAVNMPSSLVIQVTYNTITGAISSAAKIQNVKINRATDATMTFVFTNTDGTATNLTSVTAEILVKNNLTDADASAKLKLTTANGRITAPTPTNGIMLASVLAADTQETPPYANWLDERDYWYGLKVWNLAGQQRGEVMGSFSVLAFPVLGTTSP